MRAHWSASFVGAPFVELGRGPAFDCWGLVRAVYAARLDVTLPDYGEISASDLVRVARTMGPAADTDPWASVDQPQEFDLAIMSWPGRRWPGHVGVMIDARTVLHVEAASAACLVPLDHHSIRHRVLGFRRLKA